MARILVVDDERDICDLIAFTLRFAGHEVMAATNGEEAVEFACHYIPDMILLDVRMPRMNGYEACRILKTSSILKDIPVVFLSARGQESEIQQGMDVGAEEYLLKPFTPDQLTNRIKAILAKFGKGSDTEPRTEGSYQKENFDSLMRQFWQNEAERAELSRRLRQEQEQLDKTSKTLSPKSALGRFFSALLHRPTKVQAPNTQFPLTELSRITDGIVHDMRNGIGIIRNTIGFMSDDLANTPHAKDVVKISRSLDFCEVVLRNLSALGGEEVMRPEWVNLETIVREICFMLENKLVDVNLVIETDESDPKIWADQGHMKQVFMNLIKNAGEAMPDGGTLTCRFQKEDTMMKIEIQDTGRGISKANQKRLFKEFFTTKERGYGVGLFVVSSIVERHGGTISVKSTEGQGTTFTLLLPAKGINNE